MERVYWDEDRETIQPAALRRLENEALRTQLDYVWSSSPLYQAKFAQAGIKREAIGDGADLPLLPFTENTNAEAASRSTLPLAAIWPARQSRSSAFTKPLGRRAGRSMSP